MKKSKWERKNEGKDRQTESGSERQEGDTVSSNDNEDIEQEYDDENAETENNSTGTSGHGISNLVENRAESS